MGAPLVRAGVHAERARDAGLTRSQAAVVRLVAEGRTDAQVAHALHIEPTTVKTHLRHIYRVLGVHSRAELVAVAVARELVTIALPAEVA